MRGSPADHNAGAATDVQTITIDPTLESAAVLAIIVLVRTFLSFSLEVELDGVVPWRKRRTSESPER